MGWSESYWHDVRPDLERLGWWASSSADAESGELLESPAGCGHEGGDHVALFGGLDAAQDPGDDPGGR